MRRLLFFCLSFFFAAPLYAALPSGIHAQYDMYMDGMNLVKVDETFTHSGDHYRIESVAQAIGLLALIKPETVTETSEGAITAQGLKPSTYTSTRKLDTNRNGRADFDWNANQVAITDMKGRNVHPLAPGTQDRLSLMYQFMFLHVQNLARLDFPMTNGYRLDDYHFTLTPGQSVTTPLGTFDATYVTSQSGQDVDHIEIWLATNHDNFPYKMVVINSKGNKFMRLLTHIEVTP